MTIERLRENMKKSMQIKNKIETTLIKEIIGEAKNLELIDRADTTEEYVNKAINKVYKICQDQVDTCPESRQDKLEEYKARLEIIQTYLPKLMSVEEVETEVNDLLEGKEINKLGDAMKIVMPVLKGKADGKVINEVVKSYLSKEE